MSFKDSGSVETPPMVPVEDELHGDHRSLRPVSPGLEEFPELEQVHDIDSWEDKSSEITKGVTREELLNAFSGWTILPEELSGIQDFLEESRQRERNPGWFMAESRWNSQEHIQMESDHDSFEYWMSKLRKYILTPKQVELIGEFSDQLRTKNLERFEKYMGSDPIREILRSLAKVKVNDENLAQFKCFAQSCTANNNSY